MVEGSMTTRLIVLVASIVFISSTARAQSLSLENLQTRCAQKTLVYGRDGVRIGEKPDAYCTGYLEGGFALMKRAKLICPEEHVDGSFLLSVLNRYVSDKKLKDLDDAAEAMEVAYQRAFTCKKPP